MATSYRKCFRKTTTSTEFAREAVYSEFRPRDARALDQGDFVDRKPHDASKSIEIGRERVLVWLSCAVHAEGEAAQAAFEAADELRQALGIEWGDLLSQEAA